MFCPTCGFEYTQKTNYCKRCGDNLGTTPTTLEIKAPRARVGWMFTVVAMFGFAGLIANLISYHELVSKGLRGDELIVPFMLGLVLVGGVAGVLIWQLARMISTHQNVTRNVVLERSVIEQPMQPISHMPPAAQLGVPTDPIQQPVVRPGSVIEHTTRNFVQAKREPYGRE